MKINTSRLLIIFGLIATGGWITHVAWWVRLLMKGRMDTIGEGVLAILGTLVAPIGCIHGITLWF